MLANTKGVIIGLIILANSRNMLHLYMKKKPANICGHAGCGASFVRYIDLVNHVKEEHPPQNVCPTCKKTFKTSQILNDHLNTHNPDRKLFPCPECTKEFTRKTNLKVHIKSIHLEEKPFGCLVCGEVFAHKHSLSRHKRKHDAESNEPSEERPQKRRTVTSVKDQLLGGLIE